MGVGRMLVDVVTERADREGVPCYLESSKGIPNLRIYEKLGFELIREIECLDGRDLCKVSIFGDYLEKFIMLTGWLVVLHDERGAD